MSKEWTEMKVEVVGQVREVVQVSGGKFSPIEDDGGLSMTSIEPV
ncbi:MAG TPA: hypothetical protein VF168_13260 [Trueperaceae bacterium]